MNKITFFYIVLLIKIFSIFSKDEEPSDIKFSIALDELSCSCTRLLDVVSSIVAAKDLFILIYLIYLDLLTPIFFFSFLRYCKCQPSVITIEFHASITTIFELITPNIVEYSIFGLFIFGNFWSVFN